MKITENEVGFCSAFMLDCIFRGVFRENFCCSGKYNFVRFLFKYAKYEIILDRVEFFEDDKLLKMMDLRVKKVSSTR